MGWAPYGTYVLVLTLLHHAYLVLLEWMSFGSLCVLHRKGGCFHGGQPVADPADGTLIFPETKVPDQYDLMPFNVLMTVLS